MMSDELPEGLHGASRVSEEFVAALLPAGHHPAHVDVVFGENLFAVVDGGLGQGAAAAQDPGEIHVEEPQDVGAGVDQRGVDVVGGGDPVRRVRQN